VKKNIFPLLLILSCLFFACVDDNPPPDDSPPEYPVVTHPDLGKDGINEGKDYGWNAGKLGQLKQTITGTVTAAQYFYAQGLDAGWNLGNTFDAPNGEGTWAPAATQALFNGLKAQGFRIVRIPVTWYNNLGEAPTYTINQAYINRVAEVAGYAHSAGLAVVINSHHDNYWLNLDSALTDPDTYTGRLTALWNQIAEKFKEYGEWLIFEPLNEPRVQTGGTTHWNGAPEGKEGVYGILNQWQQVFVDTVRASGGNNAHRYLLVKGYAAKPFLVRDYLHLPTDSSPNKLIVDFHYYDPEGLCLNGSTTTWTVAGNGRRVRYDFEDIYDAFVKKGMPGIIGECGATYQGARTGAEKDTAHASRLAYLEHMGRTAREYGLTPVLWDNGEHDRPQNNDNFGLVNRTTGAVNSNISKAAINAFIKGIRTDL
jgi:endoglucanase